jgi:hypothetical protein
MLIGFLAMVAFHGTPAAADVQFRTAKMTREDVPLGKGQCDIRLRIDGEAEVSVRGDMVYIRTIKGRDGRNDGQSECNEPMPLRELQGFQFEVRDQRGEVLLLSEPSRRNNFRTVVRIRDSQGGEGRYHFRVSWQMDGGGPGPGYGRGPAWPGDRGSGARSALDACRDSASEKIIGDYRMSDVEITSIRADNNWGRNDWIMGEAIGRRDRTRVAFVFSCRVDLASGYVRTVEVRRR